MATHRSGYFKVGYASDMALFDTPWRRALVGLIFVGCLILPAVAPGHVLYIVSLMFISIMGALALNLLTGYAGQISLGHSAFMAVGAVSSHWFAKIGLPFALVVPLTMIVGALVGVAVGAPALRLRGLYLVVATVGLHYLVSFIITEYQTGGDMLQALTGLQMPVPDLWIVTLDNLRKWYFFLLVALIATTAFCVNLVRTRPGRAWIAIRDRDITAAALGINVSYYKILAFAMSSALTCMTGSLLVYFIGSVSAEYFTLTLAITYLAMVVIGGAGSIVGAYLGAIFVTLLPHVISGLFEVVGSSARTNMNYIVPSQIVIFGLVMILFLIFEPKGLVGIWGRVRTYFELWPLRQSILAERKR
jgi:branched-chain amino acid transport system permease protein